MNRFKSFAFVLLLSTTLFISCKENPKELIVNKWQLTDAKTTGTEKMTDADLAGMKQLVFEFTTDGKLHVTGVAGAEKTGTYSLSDDGKLLTTVSPEGQKTENAVSTLTKEKLVFKDNNSGLVVTAEPKK